MIDASALFSAYHFTPEQIVELECYAPDVLHKAADRLKKNKNMSNPFKYLIACCEGILRDSMQKKLAGEAQSIKATDSQPKTNVKLMTAQSMIDKLSPEEYARMFIDPLENIFPHEVGELHKMRKYELRDNGNSELLRLIESRILTFSGYRPASNIKYLADLIPMPPSVIADITAKLKADPDYIKRFVNNPVALYHIQEYINKPKTDETPPDIMHQEGSNFDEEENMNVW